MLPRWFAQDLSKTWKRPEVLRDPGAAGAGDREAAAEDVTSRGREGERGEGRLLRRDDLHVPRDPHLGTSIFAVGRMAGWCAQVIEQHAHNRLIRPESEYTGPTSKRWIPLAER